MRAMLTFAEYVHEHYLPHAKQHKKSWQEDGWKTLTINGC